MEARGDMCNTHMGLFTVAPLSFQPADATHKHLCPRRPCLPIPHTASLHASFQFANLELTCFSPRSSSKMSNQNPPYRLPSPSQYGGEQYTGVAPPSESMPPYPNQGGPPIPPYPQTPPLPPNPTSGAGREAQAPTFGRAEYDVQAGTQRYDSFDGQRPQGYGQAPQYQIPAPSYHHGDYTSSQQGYDHPQSHQQQPGQDRQAGPAYSQQPACQQTYNPSPYPPPQQGYNQPQACHNPPRERYGQGGLNRDYYNPTSERCTSAHGSSRPHSRRRSRRHESDP
ncbi:hypothetical protein BJ875DRAFT_94353 [Amylocarpus encephaloides]|uniref:Uncharacterized protein n=1 Tax=Amylocarpus encephaloides TaxID=45428 RepID=A0A9P7YEC5_9HELO|nr:hypothetical protein BJ875DRAFT_94353 [Amylocarpus encephaloides]